MSNYKINSLNFTVNWDSGNSQADHFDAQVKVDNGSWQDWLVNTNQTSQNYAATQDFSLYTFRARSVDNGNYSPWQEIQAQIASMPVVINEVMYNPNPGNDSYYEYIELYNPSPFDIDLQDWILVSDGASNGDPQSLSADTTHGGSSTAIKAGGYALISDKTVNATNIYDGVYYQVPVYSSQAIRLQIDDSSLTLRNDLSQAWITLKDKEGNTIDRFYYSKDWNLAQGNGQALGKVNPLRFSNTQYNWGETATTPNQQNSNFSATALNYLGPNYQISQDVIFSPDFGIYIIDNQLTVASSVKLTINPGTVIKFKYNSNLSSRAKLVINGTVSAEGTQDLPIVFTSSRDLAADFTQPAVNNPAYYGDWNYIEINSSSQGSLLDHIIVRYGGVAFDFVDEKGAFRILNSSVVIKNSIFDNNRVAGIYLFNAQASILEGLILRSHTATYGNTNKPSAAIWIKGSLPTLDNLQITNNSYGVYWPNGICQDLTNNITLIFSNNTTNTECQNKGW